MTSTDQPKWDTQQDFYAVTSGSTNGFMWAEWYFDFFFELITW